MEERGGDEERARAGGEVDGERVDGVAFPFTPYASGYEVQAVVHDGRRSNLLDYRRKTNLPEEVSDVELALHALYGHLMLRLQKKEINSQTTMAMETFSRMLAYLGTAVQRGGGERGV